jgi:CRISPR-associated endoribonuclease Cas6
MVSFVYDALNEHEPEIAADLHQHPHAPPFAVSEFVQTGPYQATDDGLTCERGYWTVTSNDQAILEAVANHARHREMVLGHTKVPVEGVELEQIEAVERARYRTLSPVYASQYRDERREDLFPDDGMWYVRLRDNVRDRMEARREETPAQFDIEDVHWWKQKRLRVGDGWASATRMEFTLRTDSTTSHFVQQQGLGERTGMGFGTVMPISHIPEEWR